MRSSGRPPSSASVPLPLTLLAPSAGARPPSSSSSASDFTTLSAHVPEQAAAALRVFPVDVLAREFGTAAKLKSALALYNRRRVDASRTTLDAIEAKKVRARFDTEVAPLDDADLVGYPQVAERCGHCHARRAIARCLNCAQKQCDRCCLWVHRQPGARHHRVRPVLPKGMTEGALLSRQADNAELLRRQQLRKDLAPEYLDGVRRLMRRVRTRIAASKANKPAMELITRHSINWTIVACATPEWAKLVFPDDPEPIVKSNTKSPSLLYVLMSHSHNSTGFCVGWNLLFD